MYSLTLFNVIPYLNKIKIEGVGSDDRDDKTL